MKNKKRSKFNRSFDRYPFQKENGNKSQLDKLTPEQINKIMMKKRCGPWFIQCMGDEVLI